MDAAGLSIRRSLNAIGSNAVAGFGTDTDGLAMGMPPSSPQYVTTQNPNYPSCVDKTERADGCTPDLGPTELAVCQANAEAACRQQYPPIKTCSKNCGRPPIVYEDSFPKSSLGSTSWDYNSTGVAHYGMLADFLQDVKNVPSQSSPGALSGANVLDNLMRGADYFYETWKRCETQKVNVQ